MAYALLGATWLVMKTEGALQVQMRGLARGMTVALLAAIVLVSLWTPLAHPDVAARWFAIPNLLFFLPVPVLVGITAWGLLRVTHGQSNSAPFLLALALLFLGYSGLGISLWPMIIPPGVTIWEAAAPAAEHGLCSGRRALHHPFHPHVHRLVVLCLPRQGEVRRGLPLMLGPDPKAAPRSLIRRLGWLALIWALGVAAMAAFAYGFRLIMGFAGLTI